MKFVKTVPAVISLCLAFLPGLALSVTTPGNLSGVETESGTVEWEWEATDDADEYQVTVDGAHVGSTDSTRWVSEGLWAGTHSLTVKAVDDSGVFSERSDTLKIEVLNEEDVKINDVQAALPTPASSDDDGLIDPESFAYPEVTDKSGYELVFSDEFNADALNPARWHSQLRWDGEWNGERYEYRLINGESQFYVNVLSPDEEHQNEILPLANPFEFDGNRLAIRATVNPLKSSNDDKTYGRLLDIAKQQEFLSGAISSHDKFSRKYGFFEARIKIPSAEGTFPAFWLFHETRRSEGDTQRTEIDIMENLGHAPQTIYNTFHYWKNVTEYSGGDATQLKPEPTGLMPEGIDYSSDFHVYAVEWEPGKITWLIDGVEVGHLENSQADYEDLYVMINLAMGGNWTNYPVTAGGLGRPADQRFPTDSDIAQFQNPALEIDYVRVYGRR
ncbi:MAG: family 16 glycosylhydrolase [Granulosicoccus sp.]